MTTQNLTPALPRKRRWRQFSLHALIVFMVVSAVGFSWLTVKIKRAREQREAVEAIVKVGGVVEMIPGTRGPEWLRKLLGEDVFVTVDGVVFASSSVGDAGLECLKGLPQLEWLDLSNTQVTDAGLGHLEGLTQLSDLDLSNTQVTDAGLGALRGMTRLKFLKLRGTKVTDAGIEELRPSLPVYCVCKRK